MRKGILKVMVGRSGSRVQEDCGDTIKIYTPEEWKKECDKRIKEEAEGVVVKAPKSKKKDKDLEDLGVMDDEDELDIPVVEEKESEQIVPDKVSKPVTAKKGKKAIA